MRSFDYALTSRRIQNSPENARIFKENFHTFLSITMDCGYAHVYCEIKVRLCVRIHEHKQRRFLVRRLRFVRVTFRAPRTLRRYLECCSIVRVGVYSLWRLNLHQYALTTVTHDLSMPRAVYFKRTDDLSQPSSFTNAIAFR